MPIEENKRERGEEVQKSSNTARPMSAPLLVLTGSRSNRVYARTKLQNNNHCRRFDLSDCGRVNGCHDIIYNDVRTYRRYDHVVTQRRARAVVLNFRSGFSAGSKAHGERTSGRRGHGSPAEITAPSPEYNIRIPCMYTSV